MFVFAAPERCQPSHEVWIHESGWSFNTTIIPLLTAVVREHVRSCTSELSMAGSPAGLARIDQLFGIDLYTSTFTASPMPFGAFPSLHAGCATIEALFMSHVFPRFRPFFVAYTLLLVGDYVPFASLRC
jgi:hypothetical protein